MSKTLLVLAASTYQIPAIRAAKRLGYRVITTDNTDSNPGHALADSSFGIDTQDVEGVLALARAERIAGIIAPGTDIAVMTAARVSEDLGLPGPSVEAARILTQKQLFREYLRTAGLPCPRVHHITRGEHVPVGVLDGGKWLVKPNRSSGSKGVFIVRTEQELAAHMAESLAFSMDGAALLEEFIDGTQHTCEGIVRDGRLVHILLTDRDTVPAPHTATAGHRVPSRLPHGARLAALKAIEVVLAHMRIADGPIDCDFVVDGGRVFIIEMTPRLGGNSLSALFNVALEIDLVAYAVAQACGDSVPLPRPGEPRPAAIAILGLEVDGRVKWDAEEVKGLRKEPWLHALSFDVQIGTEVKAFINGRHRVGEALVMGKTRDEVDARLAELSRRLDLRTV